MFKADRAYKNGSLNSTGRGWEEARPHYHGPLNRNEVFISIKLFYLTYFLKGNWRRRTSVSEPSLLCQVCCFLLSGCFLLFSLISVDVSLLQLGEVDLRRVRDGFVCSHGSWVNLHYGGYSVLPNLSTNCKGTDQLGKPSNRTSGLVLQTFDFTKVLKSFEFFKEF